MTNIFKNELILNFSLFIYQVFKRFFNLVNYEIMLLFLNSLGVTPSLFLKKRQKD
jgi:hypothetical protein